MNANLHAMKNDDEKSQSWWSTVPGTITAIATLITAIGGLIVILQSLGVFKKGPDPSKPGTTFGSIAKPVPAVGKPAATIHVQSKLVIRFPYSYDLDAGVPYRTGESQAEVDFVWEHPTSMDYEIRPDLAKFSLLGKQNFDDIDLPQLEKLQYSKDRISADLLVKGAVVAVITKEKRFGKFVVEDESSFEPSIRLVVYDRE